MHFMPAAFAARTPFLESSITRHFSGDIPSFLEDKRNISGSGLLFVTSSPQVIDRINSDNTKRSMIYITHFDCDEDAIDTFNPRFLADRMRSRQPGISEHCLYTEEAILL